MWKTSRYRVLAFLVGAVCVVLAVGAVFTGTGGTPAMKDIKDTNLYALYGPNARGSSPQTASVVKGYI